MRVLFFQLINSFFLNPAYIISSSCLSPQKTFEQEVIFSEGEIFSCDTNLLFCQEVDFKKYINPVQIRRMSRVLRMGYAAAVYCLQQVADKKIEGVIFGTGKGSMTDTEAFLRAIKDYHETALNPTQFIHSTYNQVNGLVSLNQKIDSYNVTYVHRGFSFEHSLLDAMMLLEEQAQNVLFGTFEEMTEEHFSIKKSWKNYKQEFVNNLNLFQSKTIGTIAGEGCGFFVLGNKKNTLNSVKVMDVKTLYKPDESTLFQAINLFLQKNDLHFSDIDIIMHGDNGNIQQKNHYSYFENHFSNASLLNFKHLSGEFDTAIHFGFWLAFKILEQQQIPHFLIRKRAQIAHQEIRHILLYNNYLEDNQSLILMGI